MPDSVRLKIVNAIENRLKIIRKDKAFNTDIGVNIFSGLSIIPPEKTPACSVFALTETPENLYNSAVNIMSVGVIALMQIDEKVGVKIHTEDMLADIIEAVTSYLWTAVFTGGNSEIKVKDTLSGDTSGASGYIQSVNLVSGTWAGGDAAGSIIFRRKTGRFQAETCNTNALTIGAITSQNPLDLVTGGYAESIIYNGGGLDSYPEPADQFVGQKAEFLIKYKTKKGNPYI